MVRDGGITWGFLCLSVHCHSIMGSCRIHLSTLSLTSLVLNQRRQHKSSLVDFLLVSVQHNSMVETRRQTAAYTHNGERTVGDKSLSESFLSGRQAVSRPRKHIHSFYSKPGTATECLLTCTVLTANKTPAINVGQKTRATTANQEAPSSSLATNTNARTNATTPNENTRSTSTVMGQIRWRNLRVRGFISVARE